MIYVENMYLCLVAPLLVASLCAKKAQRTSLIFVICGMSVCLLSAYLNLFFAQVYGTEIITATIEIAPLIEEVMKLLPILFYLLIFEPKKENALAAVLMVAIGFASFENICYLVEHGTENLSYLLVRGFGTGAMHIVCGAIVGYGLLFTWDHKWLKILGSFGVLCMAITFHGEYNLLMSSDGFGQILGLILPLGSIFAVLIGKKLYPSRERT